MLTTGGPRRVQLGNPHRSSTCVFLGDLYCIPFKCDRHQMTVKYLGKISNVKY